MRCRTEREDAALGSSHRVVSSVEDPRTTSEMPKPATLGSEELLGYGLRPDNLLIRTVRGQVELAAGPPITLPPRGSRACAVAAAQSRRNDRRRDGTLGPVPA